MKRRDFILQSLRASAGLGLVGARAMDALSELPVTDRMPALFLGHGNPMNAISDNSYTKAWQKLGRTLPRPAAILCISAHWLTHGSVQVTAMERPRTIHDFSGFPQTLQDQEYPAPGSPKFAEETAKLIQSTETHFDHDWGLDHGTWSVLLPMFPEADIPVFQLSMDYDEPPAYHFDLARQLRPLRDRGVLVIGSGNLVHNLRELKESPTPPDWATEFDETITGHIDGGDSRSVVNFLDLGKLARKAHPTHDHFLPLLYALALRGREEPLHYFNVGFDLGSISMRSFQIG